MGLAHNKRYDNGHMLRSFYGPSNIYVMKTVFIFFRRLLGVLLFITTLIFWTFMIMPLIVFYGSEKDIDWFTNANRYLENLTIKLIK